MKRFLQSLFDPLFEKLGYIHIQCVFFMRPKVNANFTYLYLIEINDWCLIFSSMLGHLIIYKEIQILIIMLLVKLENLKLVGFQFCCVESRICRYTKLNIFCFVLFQQYKIMSGRTYLKKSLLFKSKWILKNLTSYALSQYSDF